MKFTGLTGGGGDFVRGTRDTTRLTGCVAGAICNRCGLGVDGTRRLQESDDSIDDRSGSDLAG